MRCTHVALQVRDLKRSIGFYERYCGMRVVHERHEPGHSHVAWLGWGEDPPKFVIVLIEEPYPHNIQPPWQHIGMSVDSRSAVDEICARAAADGLSNLWMPVYAGPIVGYYGGVADPDGNMVEFSYGQRIGQGGGE
jgi:catechol 2,3-dioxygenase-like lactoylglutathione lyase family enzyme